MVKYFEISPSNILENFVECFWIMEKDNSSRTWNDIIIPNGCSEIIIPNGNGYFRKNPKTGVCEPVKNAVLIGPRTNYYLLEEFQDGSTDIGVRFKANGLGSFIENISHITDQMVGIEYVFGESSKNLEQQISESQDPYDQIKLLESYLIELQPKYINSLVESAISQIHQSNGLVKIYDIIGEMKIAKSTLERHFTKSIGMGPKSFVNICRINYSINHYLKFPSISLTQLAYQFEYFDQSHFIKTFKKYTGSTPANYFSQKPALLQVISEEVETRSLIYEA